MVLNKTSQSASHAGPVVMIDKEKSSLQTIVETNERNLAMPGMFGLKGKE